MNFSLLILLLSCPLIGVSQYAPFDSIDVVSGGYSLLVLTSESDRSTLRDSLGEFFVSDIEVLKELKKHWHFTEKAPLYACGYHYTIRLCKDGKEVDGFSVNLNCHTLCRNRDCYQFDNNLLRLLIGKTQKLHAEFRSLPLKDARDYLQSIRNDSLLIYAPDPLWMKYEGSFEFTYQYPEGTQAYFPSLEDEIDENLLQYTSDSILEKLEQELVGAYPNEPFELQEYGGSLNSITVKVYSNKSLEERFDLHPREAYQDWEFLDTRFGTYWKSPPMQVSEEVIDQTLEEKAESPKEIDTEKEPRRGWLLIAIISVLAILVVVAKRYV